MRKLYSMEVYTLNYINIILYRQIELKYSIDICYTYNNKNIKTNTNYI